MQRLNIGKLTDHSLPQKFSFNFLQLKKMDIEEFLVIIEETRAFWTLPNKGLFHNAVSAVVGQRIRFSQAREIRKKLYQILGDVQYSAEKLRETPDEDFPKGVNIPLLRKLAEPNLVYDDLRSISGIGPWTLKSIAIMTELDETLFLFEDAWIKARVKELVVGLECKEFGELFPEANRSDLSRFFWRIKPEGIQQIIKRRKLKRKHFV